jgi:hypothetical protein
VACSATACKKGGDEAAEEAKKERAPLVGRAVPGTPLTLKIPEDWKLDAIKPEPLAEAPAADGTKEPLELVSRTVLSARAPTSKAGDRITARLLVLHDPWLPEGTTTSEYLDAQRASNHRVVPHMMHVDAERSRRQGRPAYYVRDEWSAPFGEGEAMVFSQETLLLIDAEEQRLHGYSVTITMAKADHEELAPVMRELLDSVRFQK